jgi:hypothetical protein|tara:strand:+ start:64957 stop:65517 length:561 start_codon:yes stop_codon:yes gene_type:complete
MNPDSRNINDSYDFKLDEEFNYLIDDVDGYSREYLVEMVKKYMAVQLKVGYFKKELSNEIHCLSIYMKTRELMPNGKVENSLLENINHLTTIVKFFVDQINTDKIAMGKLAIDDPGAYAKMLAYRMKYVHPMYPLGDYVKNELVNSISEEKTGFNNDHKYWHYALESKVLEDKSNRVSVPFGGVKG